MSFVAVKAMRFFTKNKGSKKRIIEEWVYECVAEELEMGEIRKGLWTKARGLSEGDANKCESIYIQLRAESIVDEAKVVNEFAVKGELQQLREHATKERLALVTERLKDEKIKEEQINEEKKKQFLLSLNGKVEQYGDYEICCLCGVAQTKNKIVDNAVCNMCLKKYQG